MDLTTKNYIKNNLSYKTTYIFGDLNLNILCLLNEVDI